MCDDVEVGRGGCTGPNSNVKIGNHVGIFEKTIINPSELVEIGDNVGIGGEVMIWTHGAWLDVTQGFPSDFGPVKIGNNVWLPARSIVLPNVVIGDDTVIGIGSVINRDLPSGCFAAGSPCKVIKENCYPKELTDKEFNDSLKYTIDNIDFSSLWVGSHNENSCKYLMELMKENNIKSDDNRIWFSQLFGMSDNISFTLSDIGYNVVKLIPYGPIEKTIPYLIRRANENSSVKGQSNRQFTLIKNEINRRKKLN